MCNRVLLIGGKTSLSSGVGMWSKRQVVGLGDDTEESSERLVRVRLSRQL